MNSKRFQYHNKDIPLLKKDIKTRILFMVLFGIVFFSQLALLIVSVMSGSTTLVMTIVSAIIMLTSLTFSILSLVYSFKNMKAIDVIKRSGNYVATVSFMPNIDKNSFIRLYALLTKIIAVITLIAFVSIITYSILQFIYFETISFYLPLLLLITVLGFNSAYHMKHEIELTQSVINYQNAF